MPKSVGERIASLEATINERERHREKQFAELHTTLAEIKSLFSNFSDKCVNKHDALNKRVDEAENKVNKLCEGELTKREKTKVYGAIIAGAIPGIFAVILQIMQNLR